MAVDALTLPASSVNIPIIDDVERWKISGKAVLSSGEPVEGIMIAISSSSPDGEYVRTDTYTNADGIFSFYAPTKWAWRVSKVGIRCGSTLLDAQCHNRGYFELRPRNQGYAPQTVHVPQTNPIVFTYERATTTITGRVIDRQGRGVGGRRLEAVRSDGATVWEKSSASGQFELPASDGDWEVYVRRLNPWGEGPHVAVTITQGNAPAPITVRAFSP
jgi:hypothetical protein